MKKALIIGGGGFVGEYLASHLNECGYDVTVTKMPHEKIKNKDIKTVDLNILNKKEITEVLGNTMPEYIFHLAAQSSVKVSWDNPQLTIDVNIKGGVNVLDCVRDTEGYSPRILLIGSGEEYGRIKDGESPINEENAIRPGNIYAATKVCQNLIGNIYSNAYDMDIMCVRAFNHTGPGQAPLFVVSDFCRQAAEIELGKKENTIYVGNLSAKRDFTDVRDVVRAYELLMQKGKKGETYNVGSGEAMEINEILKKIVALSGAEINVKVDESRLRPIDVPIIEADISKLKETTGWERKFDIDTTIEDMLEYWRNELR